MWSFKWILAVVVEKNKKQQEFPVFKNGNTWVKVMQELWVLASDLQVMAQWTAEV